MLLGLGCSPPAKTVHARSPQVRVDALCSESPRSNPVPPLARGQCGRVRQAWPFSRHTPDCLHDHGSLLLSATLGSRRKRICLPLRPCPKLAPKGPFGSPPI